MINFDEHTNEKKKEHNLNWPHIPDHPYRILIINLRNRKNKCIVKLDTRH